MRIYGPFRGREITDHSPHKRITRSRRIYHTMQRIGWANEEAFWSGQDRPMRAFLNDYVFWPKLVNLLQRAEQVVIFGKHVRFAVVKDKRIQPLHKLQKVRQSDIQPEVHGVCYD